MTSFNERYAKEEKDHYQYIKERDGKWVILQKGTGKVLSHHDTREKAIAAFKAMMAHKHGSADVYKFDENDPCPNCAGHGCKNCYYTGTGEAHDDLMKDLEENPIDWTKESKHGNAVQMISGTPFGYRFYPDEEEHKVMRAPAATPPSDGGCICKNGFFYNNCPVHGKKDWRDEHSKLDSDW